MAHREKIPITIAIDGQPIPSQTLATSVGAYILVIETVLPDHAIDLHSTYTGHTHVKTQATHLILTPNCAKPQPSSTTTTRSPSCTHNEPAYTTTCTSSKASCETTASTPSSPSTTTPSRPSSTAGVTAVRRSGDALP